MQSLFEAQRSEQMIKREELPEKHTEGDSNNLNRKRTLVKENNVCQQDGLMMSGAVETIEGKYDRDQKRKRAKMHSKESSEWTQNTNCATEFSCDVGHAFCAGEENEIYAEIYAEPISYDDCSSVVSTNGSDDESVASNNGSSIHCMNEEEAARLARLFRKEDIAILTSLLA